MFDLQRLPVAARLLVLFLYAAAISHAHAQASSASDSGGVVNLTADIAGLQTNVPVPVPSPTTTTYEFRYERVSGVWCVPPAGRTGPPNFQALLTRKVADGGSPSNLIRNVRNGASRVAKLNELFNNDRGEGHGLVEGVGGAGRGSFRINLDQPNPVVPRLRTGQTVQLAINDEWAKVCYSDTQVDAIIAEAVRVLELALSGPGGAGGTKPPGQ